MAQRLLMERSIAWDIIGRNFTRLFAGNLVGQEHITERSTSFDIMERNFNRLFAGNVFGQEHLTEQEAAVLTCEQNFNDLFTIAVPAGALSILSVFRTSVAGVPYTGPCLQVKRVSDRATRDIFWNGNVVDWADADNWAQGSRMEVPIWYDQSGNGNHALNPTNDRAPLFLQETHFKSVRPLSGEVINLNAANRAIGVTFSAPPDQTALTIYHIGAPRSSFNPSQPFDGETAAFVGSRMNVSDTATATGMHVNRVGSNVVSSLCRMSQLSTVIFSSGATSLIDIDGTQFATVAASAQTITCLSLFATALGANTNSNYMGDMFFVTAYAANHSAATVTANRATFLNAFQPNTTTQTKLVLWSGNSMQCGSRSTATKSLAWVCGFGRAVEDDVDGTFRFLALPEWRVRVLGVSGRTLATEITDFTSNNYGTNVVDAGMARIIYVSGSPTNDIQAGVYIDAPTAQAAMDTLYTSWLTLVTAVKAAGAKGVVAIPCIPRTAFQQGTGNFREDARLRWNSNLLGGAVANGYVVSDWTSLPQFANTTSPANTQFYFSDGIHPNDNGYASVAVLDRATILAA